MGSKMKLGYSQAKSLTDDRPGDTYTYRHTQGIRQLFAPSAHTHSRRIHYPPPFPWEGSSCMTYSHDQLHNLMAKQGRDTQHHEDRNWDEP